MGPIVNHFDGSYGVPYGGFDSGPLYLVLWGAVWWTLFYHIVGPLLGHVVGPMLGPMLGHVLGTEIIHLLHGVLKLYVYIAPYKDKISITYDTETLCI